MYICIKHTIQYKDLLQVGKIGAKCILYARNVPTVHTFKYSVFGSYRQYPYLLGFDSNLIPKSCIFNISATSL